MEKATKIEFRISEENKEILQKKADNIGINLSEYIRTILLKTEPIFIDNSSVIQIRKIGYNVNQIVKNAHTFKEPPSQNLIDEIENLKSLIQDLTNKSFKIK